MKEAPNESSTTKPTDKLQAYNGVVDHVALAAERHTLACNRGKDRGRETVMGKQVKGAKKVAYIGLRA